MSFEVFSNNPLPLCIQAPTRHMIHYVTSFYILLISCEVVTLYGLLVKYASALTNENSLPSTVNLYSSTFGVLFAFYPFISPN